MLSQQMYITFEYHEDTRSLSLNEIYVHFTRVLQIVHLPTWIPYPSLALLYIKAEMSSTLSLHVFFTSICHNCCPDTHDR